MIKHLLVTNDFPPKLGGIQNYLWELWRRLPPEDFTVLTSPYKGASEFDRAQPYRVVRTPEPVLLPSPVMVRRINSLAREVGAEVVVLDPAVPLGLVGPYLQVPYAVALHGAEVTVPGHLPLGRQALAHVLGHARLLITGGAYPWAEALRVQRRLPPAVDVPPGVDLTRFAPGDSAARSTARARFACPANAPVVLSVSRLVPRKGMDVLIEAAARLRSTGEFPGLDVVIAGEGRDRGRLERLISKTGSPVRLVGRISDAELPRLYTAADIFVLCCRARWGGLEQEGFGIVLLEAAASGLACIAGDSGGASDAVAHGRTGLVVARPQDPADLAGALARLLRDPVVTARMGVEGRLRAVNEFSYDMLAARLREALDRV